MNGRRLKTKKHGKTSDMAAFQPGDVVVVPFPYSDRLAEKRRPAVVVSSPALEGETGLVWVVMVTSKDGTDPTTHRIMDVGSTGLGRESWVRPAKLATMEVARIARRAGQLSKADFAAISRTLARHAAFAQPA
jgi:mRNA interferase MazF